MKKNGFSLIEVLIATCIMSTLGLGIGVLINHQAKQVFYLEDQMSHQSLKIELQKKLTNPDICTSSLENVVLPKKLDAETPNSISIKNSSGSTLYKSKSDYDNINITNIKLKNTGVTGTNITGEAIFVVNVKRNRAPSNNNEMKPIEIPANVVIDDSSREVTSCTGQSEAGECLESLPIAGFPYKVPSDARMMTITTSGGGQSWGGSNGDDCSYPDATVYVHFGKTKLASGKPYQTGGLVTLTQNSQTYGTIYEVKYNGNTLIRSGYTIGQGCVGPDVIANTGTAGSVCQVGGGFTGGGNGLNQSKVTLQVYK